MGEADRGAEEGDSGLCEFAGEPFLADLGCRRGEGGVRDDADEEDQAFSLQQAAREGGDADGRNIKRHKRIPIRLK